MKFFVTGVGGQLGHDVMNELLKRGHEGVGSDIQENYSGVADDSAVTKAPYVALDIEEMGQIKVEKNVGGIEGLCVIEPAVHGDARGYFMETYNEKDMKEAGIDIHFVQDNQSMSTKGVLRGLHFQKQYPQCKLVRAVRGTVFDVAVDLRSDSTTYGKWYGVTLSAENKKQFLIPEGFAHGFLVLSDEAEFCYKVNDFWHPNDEGGMAWNDPEIGIEWPQLKGEYKGSASAEGYTLEDGTALNLSDKDQKWLGLKDTLKYELSVARAGTSCYTGTIKV